MQKIGLLQKHGRNWFLGTLTVWGFASFSMAHSPAITIPLNGNYEAAGLGIGDLDGDGDYEYLIKTPKHNIDPYFHDNPINETFKIEAYDTQEGFLWSYEMGWGIEPGVWYSPVVVYDVDQDGKDELYARWTDGDFRNAPDRKLTDANEFVVKIDPGTGKIVAKAPGPGPVTPDNYSRDQRHFSCIAYLDGKNPSLIVGRGIYSTIRLWAYDKNLEIIWKWNSDDEKDAIFSGACSHGVRAVDLDGDGRDEISVGTAVVDEYGKGLWTVQKTHPDIHHVADIDPDNPGLEIFLAMEKNNPKERFIDDVFLLDAATGRKLWGNGKPAKHVHGTGVCADLIPEQPGMELYCQEKDARETWFYTARGEPLPNPESHGLHGIYGGRHAYFSSPERCEMLTEINETFSTHHKTLIADVAGDWREEIIRVEPGRILVYSNPAPCDITGPSLMTDRYYRTQLAKGNWLSGYYYQAMLSRPVADHLKEKNSSNTEADCFSNWPAGKDPETIGTRVAENFINRKLRYKKKNPYLFYPTVITWNGALTLTQLSGNQDLNQRLIQQFAPFFTDEAERISMESHVDYRMVGSLPLEIYLQTGDERYRERGMKLADAQWQTTTEDGITNEARYWVDDMYMIGILQTQAFRATGNTVYLDRSALAMTAYLDKLQQENGLFLHAADSPFYWGRGNGWFAAGMAEILRVLPEDHPHRPAITEGFRKMMNGLLEYQGEDGLWKQLIDKTESWGETSGTAMFAFGMITGIKEGWLDAETYGPAARKAWLALTDHIKEDGRVSNVCMGTNKAAMEVGPGLEKQYKFYLSRPRVTGNFHGQGPVLWAASALLRD